MKRLLLSTIIACGGLVTAVNAQTELVANQNPNYAVSRDKYMKMSDSLTRWHSTTLQNTYEAIDWFADKEKAKAERREFRQSLRLERARWSGYDYRYNSGYYNNRYNNYYSQPNYYSNRWRRYNNWWW